MKYIGENAIKKLISLIKGDLATKQDSIAATGVLERDTTGVINGVETVGATLVETQEAKLVDVPNGLLKGDGTTISAAVAGTDYVNSSQAIRYDAAQTLTDAQKAQARANIAAAPSRFGLGENMTTGPLMQSLTEEALDTTYNNGWYFANGVNIAGHSQATIRVDSSGRTIYQTAYVAQRDGYVLRRCLVDTIESPPYNSFGPWEWINPPMKLGVEYRTTERYQGKPVYVKVVDCGNMPNNSKKMVCAEIGPGVVDKYVYFSAENYLNAYDMTVLPVNELGTYYANARIVMGRNPSSELYEPYIELFSSNVWPSSYTCRATIKYTKIAD